MIGTQSLAQQNHSKVPGKAPLSSHPGFVPAVAVWFAALLSLCSLAIRGALLESWVIAARIDLFLPVAAPPLGAKSRLLLAVGLAVVGGAIGWGIGRLLRPAPVRDADEFQLRQRDRHPDAPARRPISAHAELGDEGFGRASARDDVLADLPASRPSFIDAFASSTPPVSDFVAQPHNAVPPIAQATPFHHQQEAAYTPVFTTPAPAEPMPVFGDITSAHHPLPQCDAEPGTWVDPTPPAHAPQPVAESDALFDLPMIDFDDPDMPKAQPAPATVADLPQAEPDPVASDLEQAWSTLPPMASEMDVTPIRTIAPLRAVRPDLHLAVAPAPKAEPKPAEAPALIGATPVKPRAGGHERITQTPLGDLSHLELIERLAMAIHTREKGAKPTAVNDAQDDDTSAAPGTDGDEMVAPQSSLRTALAGLREVK